MKKAQRKLFHNPNAKNVLAFKQLKAKARQVNQKSKENMAKLLYFAKFKN